MQQLNKYSITLINISIILQLFQQTKYKYDRITLKEETRILGLKEGRETETKVLFRVLERNWKELELGKIIGYKELREKEEYGRELEEDKIESAMEEIIWWLND